MLFNSESFLFRKNTCTFFKCSATSTVYFLARQTNLLYLTQPRYKALKIEQLQIDRGARFYNSTLRAQLKQNLKGSYRTLEIKSLSNVFVIDYKFPREIQILNEGEFTDE